MTTTEEVPAAPVAEGRHAAAPRADDGERPLWFLTLTQRCNLKCIYCGSDETFDIEDLSPHPAEIDYDLSALSYLKRESAAPVICFYGGEPLLRLETIYRIMDDVLGRDFECDYVFQTNGLLLDRVDDEHLHRVRTILISVDGDAKTTDLNRGAQTYEKVVAIAARLRHERHWTGDLIARMTVGEWSDIERDVRHLLGLGLFDHVHWQLDVLWDSPKFARWDDFLGWRDGSYNPGITRLAEHFADEVRHGRVPGIVPFVALAYSVVADKPARHIRCSSGWKSFNVTTGGLVTSCPIAAECDPVADIQKPFDLRAYHQSLATGDACHQHKRAAPRAGEAPFVFDPVSVHGSVRLGGDGRCQDKCDIYGDCGGRCLYASNTDWWGADGFDEVCVTVRHLSREVRRLIVPAVQDAIARGLLTIEDLHYPRFNNTTEIIP